MMKRWLEKQKENNRRDIHQVMLILPSVRNLVSKSWSISEGNSRLQRIKMFFKILLVNALHNKSA
jgi:hypothetical protein